MIRKVKAWVWKRNNSSRLDRPARDECLILFTALSLAWRPTSGVGNERPRRFKSEFMDITTPSQSRNMVALWRWATFGSTLSTRKRDSRALKENTCRIFQPPISRERAEPSYRKATLPNRRKSLALKRTSISTCSWEPPTRRHTSLRSSFKHPEHPTARGANSLQHPLPMLSAPVLVVPLVANTEAKSIGANPDVSASTIPHTFSSVLSACSASST